MKGGMVFTIPVFETQVNLADFSMWGKVAPWLLLLLAVYLCIRLNSKARSCAAEMQAMQHANPTHHQPAKQRRTRPETMSSVPPAVHPTNPTPVSRSDLQAQAQTNARGLTQAMIRDYLSDPHTTPPTDVLLAITAHLETSYQAPAAAPPRPQVPVATTSSPRSSTQTRLPSIADLVAAVEADKNRSYQPGRHHRPVTAAGAAIQHQQPRTRIVATV